MAKIRYIADEDVEQVANILEAYETSHDGASCQVYRYNPAAIRIRIEDNRFKEWSKGERHDYAWNFLSRLPEDVLAQISVLLCLAPGEVALMDLEFHEPSWSSWEA